MISRLPLIISVPHGGDIIAPEITDRTLLTVKDIFSDGDPLTRNLYNFRDQVAFYFETTIARAVVDLNRPPDDLPPGNTDGVVKSHTVTGKRIYARSRIPTGKTLNLLLNKYHTPYHMRLATLCRSGEIFCGIDCHTMLERAPITHGQSGKKRPFICLSNRGDAHGEKVKGRRLTCSPELLRSFALFLKEQFPEERDNITLNDPFLGGYIIRKHSHHLPWIQIELNRSAYLSKKWFNPERLEVCNNHLAGLRLKLMTAIRNFTLYHLSIRKTWLNTG